MFVSISSNVSDRSISVSVAGSVDPSRCTCNSAFGTCRKRSANVLSCIPAIITAMTPNEVEAIIGGYYSDPFRILGPHQVETGWEVRAYLPQCAKASLAIAGKLHPMEKVHPQGFYVGRVKQHPTEYKLQVELWNGTEREMEDTYRFPPLLTSFD